MAGCEQVFKCEELLCYTKVAADVPWFSILWILGFSCMVPCKFASFVGSFAVHAVLPLSPFFFASTA